MTRPSFQFYPADWRNNAKLRRCSWAARGVWMDVLALLHDSDEYGILDWPLKEIAQAIGCPISHIKELVDKGVLKGVDKGQIDALEYTPRSGRQAGPTVALIEARKGPIWYSSRMVRDEYVRQKKGNPDLFKDSPNYASKHSPKPPIGEAPKPPKSDLPSSSSSSSSKTDTGSNRHDSTVVDVGEAGSVCQTASDISKAMRRFGINANPADPRMISLAEQGILTATVVAACEHAKSKKPDESIPAAYVIGIICNWKVEAAKLDASGAKPPQHHGSREQSRAAAAASIGLGGGGGEPYTIDQ